MQTSKYDPFFGIELEFWRDDVDQVRIHDEDDRIEAKNDKEKLKLYAKDNAEAAKLYAPVIKDWEKKLQLFEKSEKDYDIVRSKHDHKGHGIKYIRYSFFKGKDEVWWFQVTLDNGVLEIVAKPFTLTDWDGGVNAIADTYIYGVAEACGYTSVCREGAELAGHLSVDYTTGFSGSFANVIRFMMYVADSESLWLKALTKGSAMDYVDPYNALYICDFAEYMEEQEWKELFDMYKDALGKDYNYIKHGSHNHITLDMMSNAHQAIEQLMEKIRTIGIEYDLADEDTIDEHYMGINTESIMRDPHNQSSWRVEFRRVIMPENAGVLEDQLKFIYSQLQSQKV